MTALDDLPDLAQCCASLTTCLHSPVPLVTGRLASVSLEFRVLGPLEVRHKGELVRVGGARQRAVLSALLLRANETVSVSYLTEAVWSSPPASPGSNLRTYVAALRRQLPDGFARLITTDGGYSLAVGASELDLNLFKTLSDGADRAVADGQLCRAAERYGQALEPMALL